MSGGHPPRPGGNHSPHQEPPHALIQRGRVGRVPQRRDQHCYRHTPDQAAGDRWTRVRVAVDPEAVSHIEDRERAPALRGFPQ